MKSSFLLGYRYIFCLPSRRSRQITVRALEIIYSFCSFGCSSSSFIWQHVPASSFSLVCILQHFVSSIDMFHILLCHLGRPLCHTYRLNKNTLHIYQNVLLKNSDNYSHNFYTLSSLLKKSQNFLSFVLIHLIIFGLLHIIKESIRIFCFPFPIIFNVPFATLSFPVKRNFILNSKGRNIPY